MKTTDKYLIGIVAAIVLLIAAAFAVTLLRPGPVYQAEDAPEGVVHNYLLALQQEDFDRAYGYLSPELPGYPPDVEAFIDPIKNSPWLFGGNASAVTFQVEPDRVTADRATIRVQITTFREGGLFDSNEYTSSGYFRLQREAQSWRLISADQFWNPCWDSKEGCK